MLVEAPPAVGVHNCQHFVLIRFIIGRIAEVIRPVEETGTHPVLKTEAGHLSILCCLAVHLASLQLVGACGPLKCAASHFGQGSSTRPCAVILRNAALFRIEDHAQSGARLGLASWKTLAACAVLSYTAVSGIGIKRSKFIWAAWGRGFFVEIG